MSLARFGGSQQQFMRIWEIIMSKYKYDNKEFIEFFDFHYVKGDVIYINSY